MNLKNLLNVILKVACSVICAAVFHLIWMSIFIYTVKLNSVVTRYVLWVLAPVITSAGFATGVVLFDRLIKRNKIRYFAIYKWTFVGCAVGAASLIWIGPMLIVFGMFALGTASVIIREVVILKRNNT